MGNLLDASSPQECANCLTDPGYASKDGRFAIETRGKVTHWLPTGRDRFVEAKTRIPLAVTRNEQGSVDRIASAQLYPVTEFERTPRIVSWIPFVAGFSFRALFVRPFIVIMRKRRRRKAEAGGRIEAQTPTSPRARQIGRWAQISFWVLILTLLSWGVFGIVIAFDFGFLFAAPAVLRLLLGLMTLLSAPCALIILADAIFAFQQPNLGWPSRAGRLVLATACAWAAWLFYTFDITNFSANW